MPRYDLDPESAYRRMLEIRTLETRVHELSLAGEIAGSVHLCLGQEAIPVGAMAALEPGDLSFATYRGHGWAIASGAPLAAVMSEIFHRVDGTNGGRSGSPLLSHPASGFIGENSIVGAGYPIAAGAALALAARDSGAVAITSVGDGALNQGATLEGIAFAAGLRLPVIFVCENNGWSEMTPTAQTVVTPDLATRARGFGITALTVDGDDPFAVRDATAEAASRCRAGEGPVFLEFTTSRLSGHYTRDIEHYRPAGDKAAAVEADPLARLRNSGRIADDVIRRIDADVAQRVEDAIEAARRAPEPDPSTVADHLYGEPVELAPLMVQPAAERTYQRALNDALRQELEQREDVIVYGEDVGFAGGIFGVSRGLQKTFGRNRVFDTPIAEAAILGSAVGSSMTGLRPVVEIMWADFVFVALDQLINQAANVRYVNRSALSAPMTVRMQQGATPGSCAQHSQSIEAILAHVPGIKVGLASSPQDAYDMLRAAIADPDPTVLIEHRALYQTTGEVIRSEAPAQRAEGARLRADGSDAAIITWGTMVDEALAAAEELRSEGVEVAVLDLRWLRPLDETAIDAVVARAGGRVVIAHEATTTGGAGAEVAAGILERSTDASSLKLRRIGTDALRMPSSPRLQEAAVPGRADLVRELRDVFALA
ncbi:alpha-ketoacid dehydrogenase subunit alpha/beta [Agromyces silvae]|uniref:alpha-ketoacid dehydrogenase subunit alpha/beta n=1 Tax=Agromyces silvae TaxID=3388266 RepID=UPI00280C0AD5|nr:thiamine pyrophosphate-dependent enzyme [Agromyces protaetiae]